MALITVFLVVVALAFFFGTIALQVSKPKTSVRQEEKSSSKLFFDKSLLLEREADVVSSGSGLDEKVLTLGSSYSIANKKIELAHERLNQLEQELYNARKFLGSKSVGVSVIEKKLEELDKFKQNAEVDLIALKEIALGKSFNKKALKKPKTFAGKRLRKQAKA